MATFAYARVSSADQNLDRQIAALTPHITDRRYLYCDKASGKNFDRKAYRALVGTENTLPALQPNDTLVIMSIDRLGRDYSEIKLQWEYITHDLQCNIRVLDMPLLDTSKEQGLDGKFLADLVLQILSYVAEKERQNIKKRQREGIDVALAKGVHFGRQAITKPEGWDSVVARVRAGSLTATAAMQQLGLKRTTFYKLLQSENDVA